MSGPERAADDLRRTHLASAGVTNPVPWRALKPSERRMWLDRAK